MSGVPDNNLPAFEQATYLLRKKGFNLFSPHEMGIEPDWVWEQYLRRDIVELMRCQGIIRLEGWELSRGSRLEISIAEKLNMDVLDIAVALRLRFVL